MISWMRETHPLSAAGRIEPLKLYGNNRDKQMAKAGNRKRHAPLFPTRFGFKLLELLVSTAIVSILASPQAVT
jgi:prepilin-type N-terminal cleavage/methylation domain-containing protein